MFYNTQNPQEFFKLMEVEPTQEHLDRFNQYGDLLHFLSIETSNQSLYNNGQIDESKENDVQTLIKYIVMLEDNNIDALKVFQRYTENKHDIDNTHNENVINDDVFAHNEDIITENNRWFDNHNWAVQYLYSINIPPHKEFIIRCMDCKDTLLSNDIELINKCHRYIKGEINEFQLGLFDDVANKAREFFNEIGVTPTKKNIKHYSEFGLLINHLSSELFNAKFYNHTKRFKEVKADLMHVHKYVVDLKGSKESITAINTKYIHELKEN